MPVFELATPALGERLVIRLDPNNTLRHAFVVPTESMLLEDLQSVLCATGSAWKEA